MKENLPLAPHIGRYLEKTLAAMNFGFTDLAKAVGKEQSTMNRYRKKRGMHTDLLWAICYEIEDNIFSRIGEKIPFHYETEREKELILEIERLKKELEKKDLIIDTLKGKD